MSTAFVVLRAEVRLAGVGWNRKKNQRGGIPPRWSNDAGLVAGLFRLGRLLRPLGLVELVRLFDLLDLDDLLVCLRLAFLGLGGDVLGRLVGLLHLTDHVPELEAVLVGDDAPALVGLPLREDLVERRLLA